MGQSSTYIKQARNIQIQNEIKHKYIIFFFFFFCARKMPSWKFINNLKRNISLFILCTLVLSACHTYPQYPYRCCFHRLHMYMYRILIWKAHIVMEKHVKQHTSYKYHTLWRWIWSVPNIYHVHSMKICRCTLGGRKRIVCLFIYLHFYLSSSHLSQTPKAFHYILLARS